jgi:hypothetical protein
LFAEDLRPFKPTLTPQRPAKKKRQPGRGCLQDSANEMAVGYCYFFFGFFAAFFAGFFAMFFTSRLNLNC